MKRLTAGLTGALCLMTASALAEEAVTLLAPASGGYYHLAASFGKGGSSATTLVVDTGSTGIVVSENAWGGTLSDDGCQEFGYSSSQNYYYGKVVDQTVTLSSYSGKSSAPDPKGTELSVPTLPVFVAKYHCNGKVQNFDPSKSCSANVADAGCNAAKVQYIGVGFGRAEGVPFTEKDKDFPWINPANPLTQNLGTPQRSYMMAATNTGLNITIGAGGDDFAAATKGLQPAISQTLTIDAQSGLLNQSTMKFQIVDTKQNTVLKSTQFANDGLLPFLPDTGLNTAIVSYPKSKAPCPSKAGGPCAQDVVLKDARCPASLPKPPSSPNTFAVGTTIQLMNGDDVYWNIVAGNHFKPTGAPAPHHDGPASYSSCSRYSYSSGPDAHAALNTGQSIMDGCVWYFNAEQKEAALACKPTNG